MPRNARIIRPMAAVCSLAVLLLAGCGPAGTGPGKAAPAALAAKGVDRAAPITPVVDPGARKAALAALPETQRSRFCREFLIYAAPFSEEATISGPLRRQRSNAQAAGNALFRIIEAWYAGHPRAGEYVRDALRAGVDIAAFTVIRPYSPPELQNYNPMNEPIFQVGNFMLALAHAYAVLEAEHPGDTELLAAVRQWGDRLFRLTSNADDTFGHRARGVDRRFLIAQGWAHWGNITGNREALDAAYRYFMLGMKVVGREGRDRIWRHVFPGRHLNYANMTYGAAMTTAYALSRSGAEDVYEVAPGGGTLVEGMAWLTKAMLDARPADLLRLRHNGGRGVAWMEIFVREFPDSPAARHTDAWLAANPGPYFLNMTGGPTTCLYRRLPPQS